MFKPKKQLGQNFLKNPEIANKIASAANLSKDDTVIEIGPGTGILTDELIKTGAQIFAIEKDFNLLSKLQKSYDNRKNIKLVHQDALWFDLEEFSKSLRDLSKQSKRSPRPDGARDDIGGSYKVVANIPYNITSPLIRKFLEGDNKPSEMILMVQKEVAERITAKPGDSERGLLTLIVEFYADAEILFEVSRTEFYPVPKVDSAVIKIVTGSATPGVAEVEPKVFFKIVKAGFASKRRQIHNSLAATLRLEKDKVLEILKAANIAPSLRAEDLTLQQWVALYDNCPR